MTHSTILSEPLEYCHCTSLTSRIMHGNSEISQTSNPLPEWTLQFYKQPGGQIPFELFRSSLRPAEMVVLDICVEEILRRLGNNVCSSTWGKSLGAGLYEFRINRSLSALCNELQIQSPNFLKSDRLVLLRVFFAVEGSRIVVLLSGYDKGRSSSRKKQQGLIKAARKLLKQHKQGV